MWLRPTGKEKRILLLIQAGESKHIFVVKTCLENKTSGLLVTGRNCLWLTSPGKAKKVIVTQAGWDSWEHKILTGLAGKANRAVP